MLFAICSTGGGNTTPELTPIGGEMRHPDPLAHLASVIESAVGAKEECASDSSSSLPPTALDPHPKTNPQPQKEKGRQD